MNVHAGNIPDGACKQVYTVYTNTVVSSGSVAAECFEQKLVPRYLVPGFFLFYTSRIMNAYLYQGYYLVPVLVPVPGSRYRILTPFTLSILHYCGASTYSQTFPFKEFHLGVDSIGEMQGDSNPS